MSVLRGLLVAILLACIPFVAVHRLSKSSSYEAIKATSESQEAATQEQKDCAPFGCAVLAPIGNFIHDYKDEITASSTAIIAIFTILLVISTIALWKATKRSATIAERALTELERPFIGIEIHSEGMNVANARTDPHVQLVEDLVFRFANYGRTPATITEMFDRFEVCEPGIAPEPVNPQTQGNRVPFGVIVGANERSTGSTRSQSEGIDPNIWMTFSTGDSELYLIGFVRFRDIFDQHHITGFCLRFNKRDARFLFDGDERYNYTRKE